MLSRFLSNHVLANLLFILVLVMGAVSYVQMPRQQDPNINFNWIDITTLFPGASATDVESRVTDVIEDAVRNIDDIKFVTSNSRESVSSILIRFKDLDERSFDKRIADLRREIQNVQGDMPEGVEDSIIVEVTTANAFPTAAVVVSSAANDENLRRQAEYIKNDISRITGVDDVFGTGLADPEIQISFFPDRLLNTGVSATDLANTVRSHYQDLSAGSVRVENESWLVRVVGTSNDPNEVATLPINTANGEVPLSSLADVSRSREKPTRLVHYNGQPAIMLHVTKNASANILDLIERLNAYIDQRNTLGGQTGVDITLADDQTQVTKDALRIMQTNALLGLALVLIVTWAFLGGKVALLTCIGIPFVLAGTFVILRLLDQTLNVTVLLGIVISLGMLVDDAVVVVEAIYSRLQRGIETTQAVIEALREVFAPVTSAVLTTMAAFSWLMLLPGIMGKFMLVIPLVVITALAISLIEAYWMLPAHMVAANVNFRQPSRSQIIRTRALAGIRRFYVRWLIRSLRHPCLSLLGTAIMTALAIAAIALGMVRFDFFASDPQRIFYVNVEMPAGTTLEQTIRKVDEVEQRLQTHLQPGDARSVVGYAGQMFTEIVTLFGDSYGQLQVSLNPKTAEGREVDEILDALRDDVTSTPGAEKISIFRIAGGPPTTKPISVKVRGSDFEQIRAAADAIKTVLASNDDILDISDDNTPGQSQLTLRVNRDAARRAGIDPTVIARTIRLLVDGEVVATMQDRGETLSFRVKAQRNQLDSIDAVLAHTIAAPSGENVPLATLVHASTGRGEANIRHHNYRRAITVEADINKEKLDTVAANQFVQGQWDKIKAQYPDIDLDFSGELDDIYESLSAMLRLLFMGLGLIYLILGTQFRSYFQPFLVIVSVPMAGIGVVLGLLVSQQPLSLFTLYGLVALAGIAINAAIVLISKANSNLERNFTVAQAIVYAGRRRVVPILITSFTTIAGLFSLAVGLGGKSLLWGPVASSIVWGLGFSTLLTLFVTPTLYQMFMRFSYRAKRPSRRGFGRAIRSG